MLRFILNFFLFGILFYLIYLFFPEAFQTLVSWAHQVYEFFRDVFAQLSERFRSMKTHPNSQPQAPQHALLFLSLWLAGQVKR